MTPTELLESRAELVFKEIVTRGMSPTQKSVEELAGKIFQGAVPHNELAEVVQRSLELYAKSGAKPPEPKGPAELGAPALRELALKYFGENPRATARQCWNWIKEHGEPLCKYSSFAADTAPKARKHLGISGGPNRAKSRRGQTPAKEKPTMGSRVKPYNIVRILERIAEAPTEAEVATTVSELHGAGLSGDDAQRVKSATEARLAELRDAAVEQVAPDAPEPIDEAATEDPRQARAIVLQSPEGEDSTIGLASNDDRDRILLETPGGRLIAREDGRGLWYAEFQGAVQTDVLHALVADLVGPFTGNGAGCRKEGGS